MQKSGQMVLKGVNWVHNDKLGQMVHNDKIKMKGVRSGHMVLKESSQMIKLGTQLGW